ncbi:MAG: DNA repair protein RecN [Actinomycetota bacterium]|nr:DNA repair protein RecN [Actinomycetota bacterium]
MLKELQVRNFAIIDDARIKFQKGLNTLTGETGAGKTLIIEAINLLIGERAENDLIRDGEDELLVQGYFDFSNNCQVKDYLLSENLVDDNDKCSDLVITREVNRNGRNRSFINGIFTKVSNLKKLGELFLDIHGQHDHQYLLDRKTHLEIVDKYGGNCISNLRKSYSGALNDYISEEEELSKLKELKRTGEERLEDLNYRYSEIKKLNIKENEEESLENEARILKNYEKTYRLASEIKEIIGGNNSDTPSLRESLAVLDRSISELSGIDHKFKKFEKNLSSLTGVIEEISHSIGSNLAEFDFSSKRLDDIQERLYKLSAVKKKYNMELGSLNKYADDLKDEMESFENIDSEIDKKQTDYNRVKESLIEKALELSKKRKETIKDLKRKVTAGMADIGFRSVSFVPRQKLIESYDGIEINNKKVKFKVDGIDDIEFLISLNVGESERPLRKIASGGEISRIMLALKSAVSSVDKITTMIFDEIDAGIGGKISLAVGEKLFKISRNCQVIVITHLAQIACFSDAHYFIDKFIKNNRTKIKIKNLKSDEKVREISRMMSGLGGSDIAAMHAEELIGKCNSVKKDIVGEDSC